MWIYLYIYKPSNTVFNSYDIYWDLHSRINISNSANVLSVKCFPFGDSSNPVKYSEFYKDSLIAATWTKSRCGVDLQNKKFFSNIFQSNTQTLVTPDLSAITTTSLKMLSPSSTIGNWGFLLLRNIKLWQSYNIKYIDTSRM